MFHRRLKALWLIISVAMLVITGKLYYLQVVRGDEYRERARRNIAYRASIETRRGNLFDRNGLPLAVEEPEYEICVHLGRLERLKDARAWCDQLGKLLDKDYVEVAQAVMDLEARLRLVAEKAPEWRVKQDLRWYRRRPQPLFHHVSPDDIRKLEIGQDQLEKYVESDTAYPVYTVREASRRYYPHGTLAAHIIGYMGPVNPEELEAYSESFHGDEQKRFLADDLIGRAGIEARYEHMLRGARGELFGFKDVNDRVLPGMPSTRIEPGPGRDLRLTIDARLQRICEEELDAQIERLTFERRPEDPPVCGAVVLISPRTGDVFAAASYPRFNLNTVYDEYMRLRDDIRHPFFNRATYGAYPIGSVMKVAVATAGLEENVLSGHTECACVGDFDSGERVLKCTGSHGTIELSRAVEVSCNVYFWNAGLQVGGHRLKKWAEMMGLGTSSGSDIGGVIGQVPLAVSRAQLLNLSIGQGQILCSPLQVARMMGAIAVPGRFPEIRFCLAKPVRIQQIDMHPDRIGVLRWGMHDVVHGSRGTARNAARVEGLEYAGKTGTAQTFRHDVYHAWFGGFAPFRSPQIAFACVIENTRAGGAAGAGPVLQHVFTRMLADEQLRKYFPPGEDDT